MDFAVFSILESNACSSDHPSVALLKAKLKHCWDKISSETIRASCNQVTDRLRRVVEVKVGYIGKYFSLRFCVSLMQLSVSINILFLQSYLKKHVYTWPDHIVEEH